MIVKYNSIAFRVIRSHEIFVASFYFKSMGHVPFNILPNILPNIFMGSSKKQTTTNTYGHITPPTTPQVEQAQNISNNIRGKIDPMIRGNYAAMRRNLNDSFSNPMGAYTTPAIRDATLRSGNQELDQQENLALSSAELASGNAEFERQMGIAQLTAPQLIQTGGTQTQSGGFLGDLTLGLVGAGGRLGSAALM